MKIAIHASELDQDRIDGNRVYLLNLLKNFGQLDKENDFFLYHRNNFNPELAPPDFSNYKIKKLKKFPFWTQIIFPQKLSEDKPDILWMSIQAIPFFLPKLKSIVTIHDLAPKIFPEHFKFKDRFKLNLYLSLVIKKADKIIAISENTKKDILKFYPKTDPQKIKVIHHGFDCALFDRERDFAREAEVKKQFEIAGDYILYTGAIQPRKNLITLVSAFELLKKEAYSGLKLVIAGKPAWKAEKTLNRIKNSPYRKDIIIAHGPKFDDLSHLYRGARVFVYPPFYEGFGIPILEAMSAKIPVIAARNSSLTEIGKDCVIYFNETDSLDLKNKIKSILDDAVMRQGLIEKAYAHSKNFSWEKCAAETLKYLKD